MRRRVLVVAGLDPSGGAGFTADLAVLSHAGLDGVVAPTAITVQTAERVRRVVRIDPEVVSETIGALGASHEIAAVKIGMLATAQVVEAVARSLPALRGAPVVLDPVLASGTGVELLEPAGVEALRARLLPLANVVTPNVAEAERLSGIAVREPRDLETAARALRVLGARAVLVKGGHLSGAPDDLWVDDGGATVLAGERVGTGRIHGAGCALATWIAAGLAQGLEPLEAARRAKREVAAAIARSQTVEGEVRELRW